MISDLPEGISISSLRKQVEVWLCLGEHARKRRTPMRWRQPSATACIKNKAA
jgi:hypothetical protein